MTILKDLSILAEQYPEKSFVFDVNKDKFLCFLNELKEDITNLPEEFPVPEGNEGLLIYLLIKNKFIAMEDEGEFNRQLQGTRMVLEQSIKAVKEVQSTQINEQIKNTKQ